MPWEDNMHKRDGIASCGWVATHLGTSAGGTAESSGKKEKRKEGRKERNSSASCLLLPNKPAGSPRCSRLAHFPCSRIHLLTTIPHLL